MCYNKNVKIIYFFGDDVMRIRSLSLLLSFIFVLGIVFSAPVVAFADENTWNVNNIELEHASISFQVRDIDRAQDALMCIEFDPENDRRGSGTLKNEDASSYIEIPFSITNTYQTFKLDFPDNNYLEAEHEYRIYIKNENGDIVFDSRNQEYSIYVIHSHSHSIDFREAESVIGKTGAIIYDYDDVAKEVYTTVNLKKYKGERIKERYLKISYPEQEIGSEIEFVLSDGYGCEKTVKGKVRKEFSDNDIKIESSDIIKTSAKANYYGYSASIVRMCVEINGNVYYSDYKSAMTEYEVNYPETAPGTEVKIWFEGEFGTKSEVNTYSILEINRTITVNSITKTRINASVSYDGDSVIKQAYIIYEGKRIEGKIDDYDTYNFDYNGELGKKVSVYFVDDKGYECSTTVTVPTKHEYCFFNFAKCNVKNTIVSFYCNNDSEYFDTMGVKSATLTAGGKTYKMKKFDYSDYESEYDNEFFKASYSIKKGTKVTVKIVTKDGYTYTKTAKAAAVKPVLSICPFYSGENKLYIYTVPKSKVNIKIGSKKYKGTADKDGYVVKKVKPKKSGTKIIVSVKDPTNCTNIKKTKVKSLWGQIYLKNKVYTYSSKVKIKVTKVIKNDKVKLTIGNKTYTKKVKKKEGSSTLTFKIKKPKAGSKIKIKYTDSFGKKKGYFDDDDKNSVFIGDKIYNGMSEKNCVLTSWGYPVIRNNYNGLKQWKFVRGGSYCWVYIQNGRVTRVNHYNY